MPAINALAGFRQTGLSSVEFVIVAPFLLFMMFMVAQFSWIFNNYYMVANAAGVGARFLANQRKSTTAYSDTLRVVRNSAGMGSELTITTSVNGANCTDGSNPTCGNALETAAAAANWQEQRCAVTATYRITPPFQVDFGGLNQMWPTQYVYTVWQRVVVYK